MDRLKQRFINPTDPNQNKSLLMETFILKTYVDIY